MKKVISFVMLLSRRYRVYFNPQGQSWYADYRSDKTRVRTTLGVKTKPEAEEKVKELDGRLQRKLFPAAAQLATPVRLKWSDLQEHFLVYKTSMGKAPKTITRYKAAFCAFGRYLATQGASFVDEVTLKILDGFYSYRIQQEKCVMVTAHDDAIAIKTIFKWAARPSRGLLSSNPTVDWETPEPVVPKKRVYLKEEVATLECGTREWLRDVVTILAWTGMRIGELINLRWKDVDLKERLIHVRIREDWRPKGKADRNIPLHPKVEAVLRSLPIGDYMLRGPYGGKLKEAHCLKALKEDQKKLGLPIGDLHGFRRFFATEMLRAGVDIETVRQWGGWKSLETMLRYLADVRQADSVKLMDQAAAKLAAS